MNHNGLSQRECNRHSPLIETEKDCHWLIIGIVVVGWSFIIAAIILGKAL